MKHRKGLQTVEVGDGKRRKVIALKKKNLWLEKVWSRLQDSLFSWSLVYIGICRRRLDMFLVQG